MKFRNLAIALVGVLAVGSAAPAMGQATTRPSLDVAKRHPAPAKVQKSGVIVPAKTAYAWATRDRGDVAKGIVSFALNEPSKLTSVHPLANLAYAGCYANGKYYFDRYRTVDDSWEHIAFSSIDLKTGAITDILDWSDEYFVINDMTYDYVNERILAMGRTFYIDDFLPGFQFECSVLMSINPTTGVTKEEHLFIDWANGAMTNPTYYNIACDLNGVIYTVNQNGWLVTLDPENDYSENVIGSTGVNPAHTTQSMEFDHSTGTLYWAADFSSEVAQLLTLDTGSGLATSVGETGTDAHLVGLYIPFDVPSQAAPGAVTQLKAVPADKGGLSVTLSWTNPTKSYGGTNLASVSSVKVLRNEVEVASLTGTRPGEPMSYVDNVDKVGLYSYTIVPVNSAGNGMPSGVTRWIGLDVPMAVTELGIGRNDDGSARLEWLEPTEGAHGGQIDMASLGYKITRFPDGTIVATDAKGDAFDDTTIPGTGRYYYTVESHTAQGVGQLARTAEIALGAGIDKYPWSTLFADPSEFGLWTVVDNNGGSTWKWKSRTAGGYEAQAMYEYDHDNDGDDYLISPDMYMQKGARYKVKFAYAGANAYHTENLEVTFGQGKTAEVQTQVLKELEMKDGTFRFCEVELPEVDQTGYYNFAFHAVSKANNYNVYVTDVTVTQTVAAPDEPTPGATLAKPENLAVSVDAVTGDVTLTWNESTVVDRPLTDNITEDFESMTMWEINPAGVYGWTYVDGDGGIPYKSDWADMPYPTDGVPLAAMVMAPNEIDEYTYTWNPAHSGSQYLLFKSNFSDGEGKRPAPAPDDWFISPELNFGQDFLFSFYCKADPDYEGFGTLYNTEYFQVGYSTTDNDPESFIWMSDQPEYVTNTGAEWKKKEYSMPADAKYVCIHYCTPDCGFWFMIDDVYIGLSSGAPRAKAAATFKAYDVYINNDKVATTTNTMHIHSGLTAGAHVAKVVAVYEEGESEPAVAQFVIGNVGVESIEAEAGLTVTAGAGCIELKSARAVDVAISDMAGRVITALPGFQGEQSVTVAPGVYLVNSSKVLVK